MVVRLVRCDTLRVVCCERREKRGEREERVIELQDRYHMVPPAPSLPYPVLSYKATGDSSLSFSTHASSRLTSDSIP
ncbi:hypothetical protein ACHAWO_002380 [Cyclotella atomus]|uniref:Uncharacterized protein n=1 Tax=Cyclotella atomus TaxID=382360 RepID=A0ABD3PXC5_9STRA